MELLYLIILVICGIALILCIWGFICNEIAYRQRDELINQAFQDSNYWWKYMEEFNKVSYDKHMYTLMMFKNPKKLYSPLAQSLWG